MSLNTLQLNPQLLAELYGHVLVETEAAPQTDGTPIFIGGNKKNILVVVSEEKGAQPSESQLQFLISVLKACQLSIADVAVLNLAAATDKHYRTVTRQCNSKTVLLFDVTPLAFGLPVHFPHFQVQRFDQCTYLAAPSLTEIENDKELKKQLWAALKKLFSI